MPVVTIAWVRGRDRHQKEIVAERVTGVLVEVAGVRPDDVWVVFRDVDPGDWAVAGRLVDNA